MKRIIILMMICLIPISSTIAFCEEKDRNEEPWEKAALNIGGFIANTDTNLRLGSGLGLTLDMNKILNFDTTSTVFRVNGSWRFTENRKHRLDLSWFSYNLSGTKQVTADIPVGDGITAGQTLDGFFNLDIYQVEYSYSFFQDDRIDLAARLGVYVMPLEFGLKADGLVVDEGDAKFTAPLPTFGLRMDVAVAPKWFIRSGSRIFYLEYESFKGKIISMDVALEYQPWKHVGFGLGFDSLSLEVEADGQDYPEIDFSGNVEFKYTGLQLYAKFMF
jgi:hypothetical protein